MARSSLPSAAEAGHPSLDYQIAMIQLALGDVDATFDSLVRACAGHDIGSIWLSVDPIWDPVRNDERFARLVASMGLDPATTW